MYTLTGNIKAAIKLTYDPQAILPYVFYKFLEKDHL